MPMLKSCRVLWKGIPPRFATNLRGRFPTKVSSRRGPSSTVTESGGSGRLLGLYNRGEYGTGHGWGAAHFVAWNNDLGTASAAIQKRPLAQNYTIGGEGDFDAPFPGPRGHIEHRQGALVPSSLYEAQLCDRLQARAEAE